MLYFGGRSCPVRQFVTEKFSNYCKIFADAKAKFSLTPSRENMSFQRRLHNFSVHKRAVRLKKQFLKSVTLTTLRTKRYYRLSIDWGFRYKQAVLKWEIRTKSKFLKTLSYCCVSKYIRDYIYWFTTRLEWHFSILTERNFHLGNEKILFILYMFTYQISSMNFLGLYMQNRVLYIQPWNVYYGAKLIKTFNVWR